MLRTRLVCVVSTVVMACGLAVTPTPASAVSAGRPAARPQVAAAASTDATLSGLAVTGGVVTGFGPPFAAGRHDYDVVTRDDPSVDVHPTTTDGAATVRVSLGSTDYPLSAGVATVPLIRGRNDLVVTVTAADLVTTETYRAAVWRAVAPSPQILSVTNADPTFLGGTRSTVTLAHASTPPECFQEFRIGPDAAYPVSDPLFDPRTGSTKVVLQIPTAREHATGPVDLVVTVTCGLYLGWGMQSQSTARNAYTYTDDFQVTSAEVPEPVTVASLITLHGPGVVTTADAVYWMTDSAGHASRLSRWGWTGDDNAQVYPNYHADGDDEIYDTPGPRTLNVGYCDGDQELADCTVLWSKPITWKVPAPADLSFTPASGPITGGTEIRLRGRFLYSGIKDHTYLVGGQEVTDWYTDEYADEPDDYTYTNFLKGYDTLVLTAPPTLTPGPVQVTAITNHGTATARGTFTYAAKPTLTGVTPAAVANTGGSVITLTGTAFGAAGRPTVIVNGVKSPFVTRLSTTRATAVVPAFASSTGPVDVQVSSSQGGGISDPVPLTLTAPGTAPTVATVSPTAAKVGDPVTLTGTGFGAAGTVGVSVGGAWARVTASTATSVTFEVPAVSSSGAKDLVVGTTTGRLTRNNGLTVVPDAGITGVSPASVPSYATGADATVVLTGAGFGSSGTVKVGPAAARPYTASDGGTRIAGVVVPTTSAASLPIVVTPAGGPSALKSAVRVTGPVINYSGPQPRVDIFAKADPDDGNTGVVYDVPTTGGPTIRLEGTGFGSSGVVKVGSTSVPTTSWSDTVVTFDAPARPAGDTAVVLTPGNSSVSATRSRALHYLAVAGLPSIATIASETDLGHANRNEFHSEADLADGFILTGTNLAGSSAPATRVTVSDVGGENPVTQVPTAVTATSLHFAAPRSFTTGGWKRVTVTTDTGSAALVNGVLYLNAGPEKQISPSYGLCLRTPQTVSGGATVDPAVITITNTGTLFGTTGAVTIGGTPITPTSYSETQVVLDLADLPSDLTGAWGNQQIVITPADSSKPAQSLDFLCALVPSVATTANAGTAHLTVAAGTDYDLGYTHTGFLGVSPFTATAPDGYDYVTAADFGNTGFTSHVHAGRRPRPATTTSGSPGPGPPTPASGTCGRPSRRRSGSPSPAPRSP